MVKVEYVLAPTPTELGSKETNGKWHEQVLYVQGVSGDPVHSPECDLAVPVRAPVLELHPMIHAQVLRFLKLRVPPVEILADNVRQLRDYHSSRVTMDGKRLLLENQVCVQCACGIDFYLKLRHSHTNTSRAGYCQHSASELEAAARP